MRTPQPPRTRGLVLALCAAAVGVLVCVLPAVALAAGCPDEAVRSEARSTLLAQCRVYELVSPVYTADSGVQTFLGVAPDGEAAAFLSAGGFAGVQSDYAGNFYIARRGSEGWQTSAVGIPAALGGQTSGVVTSFDLTKQLVHTIYLTGEKAGSHGLLLSEDLAAAPAFSFGELSEYRNIPFEPLRGLKQPEDESPNFSHVVVPSNLSTSFGEPKLYEISGVGGPAEALRLVSVVGFEEEPINAVVGRGNGSGGSLFHAVSNDGAEIFFTKYDRQVTGPSYVRVNGSVTLPLGGLFQGASEDGSKVFLSGSTGELYMDVIDGEPGDEAVTEKVAITPGAPASYLRSGDDGSHVYFLSTGVFAGNENGNTPGEKAEVGKPNLYVYDTLTREVVFIAQAEPAGDISSDEVEAQVNGCPSVELGETEEPGCEGGRFFVFASTAHITPGDTASGQQVFEYDADSGQLARVSTGEGGYANNGNSGAGNATIAAPYFGAPDGYTQTELFEDGTRAVSDDGSTVVFSTARALSPRAVNDQQSGQGPLDVYEYHDGQVSLISTGRSLTSDEQPTITPSGRDIFFASTEGILPQDTDGLESVYDARIEGGFPAALVPPGGCNGDACQGPPSVPDLLGAPASATFSGLGNPTPAVPTPAVKPGPKSKPRQCRKGYVRRQGRCVKRSKAKKAGHNRRVK